MLYTSESTGLRYLRLAFYLGYHYFRTFAVDFPEDFQQVIAAAAWEAEGLAEVEANRFVSKRLREAVSTYGYRKDRDTGIWTQRPAGDRAIERACGVPECQRAGGFRDPTYHFICARHYDVRRRGKDLAAAEPRKTARRVLMDCAECGEPVNRPARKQVRAPKRRFCNLACRQAYEASSHKPCLSPTETVSTNPSSGEFRGRQGDASRF